MTTQAVPARIGSHALDPILRADVPLLTLETLQPDAFVEQVCLQVRRSGQAVYLWQAGEGLRSLRETGLHVPGCLRLSDTLRYVSKSRHFGIYLVAGVTLPLAQTDRLLLRRIAHSRTEFVRRVVLLADGPELAQHLGKLAVPLKQEQVMPTSLRLRDGRWVH